MIGLLVFPERCRQVTICPQLNINRKLIYYVF